MNFIYDESLPIIEGVVSYKTGEYSFDFEVDSELEIRKRISDKGKTSIAIGTLQLEVDVFSGLILYAWGYHPYFNWKSQTLSIPFPHKVCCIKINDEELKTGVSIKISEVEEWETFFDEENGWVCITSLKTPEPRGKYIKFAANTIAEIDQGKLLSLWLCPVRN